VERAGEPGATGGSLGAQVVVRRGQPPSAGLGTAVTAIVFGLLCAGMWAYGSVAASRAVRILDAASVVAWVMLLGFVIWLPVVIASGVPRGLRPIDYLWLVVGSFGNVLGLVLTYTAYRIGKVGVVAAVVSTEGGIVAVLAAVDGESIAPVTALLLTVIVLSVVVVAATPDPVTSDRERPVKALALSCSAAVLFGSSLFATSQLGRNVSLSLAVLPPRAAGALVLALPLAVRGRLQVHRKAMPLVASVALSEVLGTCAYVYGTRSNIAVASVVAAQFPAMSAVAAYLLFKERLSRVHLLAVVILAAATAVLAVASH
jgi:drug/metabolite transporter (DMT)-like permease